MTVRGRSTGGINVHLDILQLQLRDWSLRAQEYAHGNDSSYRESHRSEEAKHLLDTIGGGVHLGSDLIASLQNQSTVAAAFM